MIHKQQTGSTNCQSQLNKLTCEAVTDGLYFHSATYNWYFNNFKAQGLKNNVNKSANIIE
jgi:hypothetical protein